MIRSSVRVLRFAVAASVVGLCLGSAAVFAGPVGSLVIDGSATIHVAGNGSAVEARGTHTVFAGDRIDTRMESARLMLRDGSVIRLAPSSSLVVRDDVNAPGSIELVRGRMTMDARSDDWSVLRAGKDRTGVSAGSSVEFEAESDAEAIEAGEDIDERSFEPAPRPQSIS